ncbi:MAG TPA: HXXEE domain-containing protein [Xanthobacteraceae bacterium]|nr:HXXEE domain-containing protein [Xanthobacteraceae bacterium]
MRLLSCIAANWQKALPYLSVLAILAWIVFFRSDPLSERALWLGLLIIYMLHQIEEHLWPGGFRQFTNAHVFKSGNDNWPVDIGGVALINIGFVWLPVSLAVLYPEALRWVGLGWIGLTLINALTHIVSTIRLRIYNPGLITSIVLFLPFTIFVLALEAQRGTLSGTDIGLIVVAGILLHVPVAALFVMPYLRRRAAVG